jgi:hypothetical protein
VQGKRVENTDWDVCVVPAKLELGQDVVVVERRQLRTKPAIGADAEDTVATRMKLQTGGWISLHDKEVRPTPRLHVTTNTECIGLDPGSAREPGRWNESSACRLHWNTAVLVY